MPPATDRTMNTWLTASHQLSVTRPGSRRSLVPIQPSSTRMRPTATRRAAAAKRARALSRRCDAFNRSCEAVNRSVGAAMARSPPLVSRPLHQGLDGERHYGEKREEGGHRERTDEVVLVVQDLDREGHRVGEPAD